MSAHLFVCCDVLRTPLHCAASCNNTDVSQLLVQHGACVLATTLSDSQRPVEKCEPGEDNFESCLHYLQGEMFVTGCSTILQEIRLNTLQMLFNSYFICYFTVKPLYSTVCKLHNFMYTTVCTCKYIFVPFIFAT